MITYALGCICVWLHTRMIMIREHMITRALLQHTATPRNIVQHPATNCSTLQHPATPCNMRFRGRHHTPTNADIYNLFAVGCFGSLWAPLPPKIHVKRGFNLCKRDLTSCLWTYDCICEWIHTHMIAYANDYEVVTISRLLKIVGLFCKRALSKRLYSAK